MKEEDLKCLGGEWLCRWCEDERGDSEKSVVVVRGEVGQETRRVEMGTQIGGENCSWRSDWALSFLGDLLGGRTVDGLGGASKEAEWKEDIVRTMTMKEREVKGRIETVEEEIRGEAGLGRLLERVEKLERELELSKEEISAVHSYTQRALEEERKMRQVAEIEVERLRKRVEELEVGPKEVLVGRKARYAEVCGKEPQGADEGGNTEGEQGSSRWKLSGR